MWNKGPMPKDTYGWGAVVPVDGIETSIVGEGFYFADFQGDRVKILPGGNTLQAHEIAQYDNSLTLPPKD